MRGICRLFLCASAAALSGGAWAQANGDLDPIDPLASQARSFEVEADAAEAAAKARKEAAQRTADFIAQLKTRRDAGGASSAEVEKAIAALEARLLVEQQSAATALQLATDLRNKADAAGTALAALHIRLAPFTPEPQPKTPPSKPVLRASSFGRTFDQIFSDPNDFMRPPRESKLGTPGPDGDQKAPDEVAAASARSIGGQVGAFLFDRPIDRRTSGVSLDLSNEDSRLGLQFSFPQAGKYITCSRPDGGKGCRPSDAITGDRPYLNTYSFGFSASAKDNFGKIFTGGETDTFADKLKFTVGYSWTGFRSRNRDQMMYAMQVAENGSAGANLEAKCRQDQLASNPLETSADVAAKCTGEALRSWALAGKEDLGVTSFSRPERRAELLAAIWGQQEPVWDAGINGEIGYRSFKYQRIGSSDPADLDATNPFGYLVHKSDELEWQISTHIGHFFYDSPDEEDRVERDALNYTLGTPAWYAALLSESGQEWEFPENTEDQTICRSIPATIPLTRCDTLDIDAPVLDWFWRVGGQLRFGLGGGGFVPRIGLSPKVTYEVTGGRLVYDLPISFLQSSDGKLNGGIRIKGEALGRKPDEFSVGFFLGTSFSVVK
jgi:hypothetical protein